VAGREAGQLVQLIISSPEQVKVAERCDVVESSVFAEVIAESHGHLFGESAMKRPVVCPRGEQRLAPLSPVSFYQFPFLGLESLDLALDADQACARFPPVILQPVGIH
jgi:hypothetical protein